MRRWAIISAAVALQTAQGMPWHPPSPERQPCTFGNTLEVKGRGELSVAPDFGTVEFKLRASHDTSSTEAKKKVSGLLESVLGLKKKLRIDPAVASFKPESLQVRKDYSWDKGQSIFSGYTVEQTLKFETKEPGLLPELLEAASDIDGVEISDSRYSLSDSNAAEANALRKAVRHAHARAWALADAGGVVLGPPCHIEMTSRGGSSFPNLSLMRSSAKAVEMDESSAISDAWAGDSNISIEREALVVYPIFPRQNLPYPPPSYFPGPHPEWVPHPHPHPHPRPQRI